MPYKFQSPLWRSPHILYIFLDNDVPGIKPASLIWFLHLLYTYLHLLLISDVQVVGTDHQNLKSAGDEAQVVRNPLQNGSKHVKVTQIPSP